MFTRKELVARTLAWHDLGVGCIPLVYRHKNALVKWKGWAGKCPPRTLVEHWMTTRWQCNFGVMLGAVSQEGQLVVLDFDYAPQYIIWRERHKQAAKNYTVKTSRGWHVYVWLDHAPDKTLKMLGGEVKATGYVLGEGSIHQTGWRYASLGYEGILVAHSLEELDIQIIEPEVVEQEEIREITPTSTDKTGGVVSRIKDAISITGYLSRWTDLHIKSDGTYMGVCPFHRDSNPSLQVWPREGRAYCHSPGCKAHRKCDVITCAQLALNVSVQEAIRILAQELG